MLAACQSEPTPTPSPFEGYLAEEIPPCTPIPGLSGNPCTSRGPIETFGAVGSSFYTEEPWTIRQFLDGTSLISIPHVVLRGTYLPGTVRCTSGDPYRIPSYEEPDFLEHSILINCYADVRVSEYILGKGPARLTALVYFHHYWKGYYAPTSADDMTEQEAVELMRWAHKSTLEWGYDPDEGDVGIYGREVILFIGPGHSHAHEVWEVVDTWYVQQREDGTIIAVHPDRDDWREFRPDKYREYRADLEMDLPRFAQAVTAANQARVSENGGRVASVDIEGRVEGVALPSLISDIHDLDEFMASTGAYDHADGTPVPPPPVPGDGDPVPDIGVDDSTPGSTPQGPGEGDSTPAAVP